jgi:hypothetical protein
MKTKTCYTRGLEDEVSFEQEEREASALFAHMKAHPDWSEKYGIALFEHKSGLFMMDCNADTATVYKRDSVDEQYYTGSDGFYVFIDNIENAEEWFKDEFGVVTA